MDNFASPARNIERLSLPANPTVVDLGAGSGFYSFALAEALKKQGGTGKVYALDVQKDLLERIKQEANRRGLGNISVIWGDIDVAGGTKLADRIADAIVVSNVLFQAHDKASFMKEAARILKPGGQMLLIEWSEEGVFLGPGKGVLISKEQALDLAKEARLEKVEEFQAGARHYGIIFKK